MSAAPRKSRPREARLAQSYLRAAIEPSHMVDVFKLMNLHQDGAGDHAAEQYERIVDHETATTPGGLTKAEWRVRASAISSALPMHLRLTLSELREHDAIASEARVSIALRVGIEIGRIMAGGAR